MLTRICRPHTTHNCCAPAAPARCLPAHPPACLLACLPACLPFQAGGHSGSGAAGSHAGGGGAADPEATSAMIEKEKHKLEVLKRRQERDIQQARII